MAIKYLFGLPANLPNSAELMASIIRAIVPSPAFVPPIPKRESRIEGRVVDSAFHCRVNSVMQPVAKNPGQNHASGVSVAVN